MIPEICFSVGGSSDDDRDSMGLNQDNSYDHPLCTVGKQDFVSITSQLAIKLKCER